MLILGEEKNRGRWEKGKVIRIAKGEGRSKSGFVDTLCELIVQTLEKCRKHSDAARVFYISLVFSNARRILSQCNTRLRLLYLLL